LKLGYTTPPPPTPQQILKTLRNINTLLQIRLNLHEHLPPYFKTFTIKSGRATFVVPEEFEVDLSIAKEDIESQFYFIDLRLLFSPIASGLPEGQWRAQFEEDCNVILKTQGLAGLYHHLHEFILTTKINLLRRQAIEMSRRKWIETLHVEMLRRLLVVQYWVGKPGPKHWIEISVLSGKQMDEQGNVKSQGPSYLDIRWARDGQRLPGSPPIKLDCQNLTMENILNAIIGLHVKHILLSTRAKLMETKLYATSALALSAKISKKEPADSFLSIQLLPLVTSTISIQPILGSFAFQPSTPLARRAEGDLNTLPDPAGQAYSRIFNARCLMTQEAIEFQAAKLQWNIIRNLRFKQEELKRTFSRDTLQISYFRSEGWSPNWILAVSIGMRAEEWWILEMYGTRTNLSRVLANHAHSNQSTSNPTILVGRRVPIILPSSKAPKIDTPLLTMISIAAAGICSQYTNIRVLENSKIPYRLLPQTTPRSSPLSPYSSFPTLLISFYHLMKLHRSPTNQYGAWARDVLAIRYRGLSAYSGKSVAIIETRILYPKAFAGISTQSIDKDIAFHPKSGGIAIRLRAQIGVSIIQQLYGRLRRIERILSFVMVIKRFHLKTTKISLSHVAFLYASSPSLTAEISLDGNAPMALTFNENNPHHLLIDHLTHLLNSHTRFEPVIISLALTLALCRALITLMADETVGDIAVLPRSSLEILLKYQRAGIAFDMRLRKRRKEMLWYICQDKRGPPTDESLKSELKKIFEDSGEGWIGLDTAIAASSTGVEEVIGKLHAAVRAHVTQKKAKSNDKIDEKSGIKNQKLVGLD
jgi:mediator of RNA polymerase II transcription subunit 14